MEISKHVLSYNTSYFLIAGLVPQDKHLCGFQILFFPGISYNSLVPFLNTVDYLLKQ